MTEPEPLQQLERTFVRFQNRKLLYFSGCDYFRLASHPQVLAATANGLKKHGLNVAASRMTTGNHRLYVDLERHLADFFEAPEVLLVASGYITNLVVAQALAGSFSHVFIDERSHSSLRDAARFFDCPIIEFRHRDAGHVAESVKRCGPGARIILLTDGMFSYNGTSAPLREYASVLPRDAMLLVDDAHGAGVLGKTGKGTAEHEGLDRRRIIQTITLSKAFGAYGGAILTQGNLRHRIIDQSRLFSGNTPLPLPLAAAAIESVRVLRKDKSLRQRLFRNSTWIKSTLQSAGLQADGLQTIGPIVTLVPSSPKQMERLRRDFLRGGILPPITRYPGVPGQGYFRFVISSEHTEAQLQRLVSVVAT